MNWVNVGYFAAAADKLNSFQLLLIDRSDIAPNAFDIVFNYDKIQWETGSASGGVNGLGGSSARAGYSNGVSAAYELPGSAVNGAFLDTNPTTGLIANSLNSGGQLGRYIFNVRNGVVVPPNSAPVVTATGGSGYVGSPIAISGTASDADDDPLTIGWTAPAGCTIADPGSLSTTITCESPGDYTVTLSADDGIDSASANALVSVIPVCSASNLLDGFNRANGRLGANWRGATSSGRYKITGQAAYADAGGLAIWGPARFGADQIACMTLSTIAPNGQHHTLALKAQSTNFGRGVILVSYNAPAETVVVEYRSMAGNSWVTAGSWSQVLNAGDGLGARALANGDVQVFVNNTLIGTVSTSSFYANRGGSIGVFYDSTRAGFDDFGGGNP